MKSRTVVLLVVGGLLVYALLGAVTLSMQKETIRGRVGQVWNANDRAAQVLDRLEGQMEVFLADRQDLIQDIANARRDMQQASQDGDLEQALAAQDQAALAINVVVEAYPDLDLSGPQQALMDETSGSLNRIAYARQELIDAQVGYNRTRILFLPVGLVFPREQVIGEGMDPMQSLPPSSFGQD